LELDDFERPFEILDFEEDLDAVPFFLVAFPSS